MRRRHLILLGPLVIAALVTVATVNAGLPAPDTTIDSGPSGVTNSTSASFAFSSPSGSDRDLRLRARRRRIQPVHFAAPHPDVRQPHRRQPHVQGARGPARDPRSGPRRPGPGQLTPSRPRPRSRSRATRSPTGPAAPSSHTASPQPTTPTPTRRSTAAHHLPSGTVVAVGQTVTITCEATDARRQPRQRHRDIHRRGGSRHHTPVVTPPASRTVEANGSSGALVNYESPTAVDNVDGPLPPNLDHLHEAVGLRLPARRDRRDLLGDGQQRPHGLRLVHDHRGGHDAAGAHRAGRPRCPVELRRPGEQFGDPGLPQGRESHGHRRQQRRDHPQRAGDLPARARPPSSSRPRTTRATPRRRARSSRSRPSPSRLRPRRTRRLRTTSAGSRRSRATCPSRSPGARPAHRTSTTSRSRARLDETERPRPSSTGARRRRSSRAGSRTVSSTGS